MVFANAAISALVAVSSSGAPLELPDWVVCILVISFGVALIFLPFRILRCLWQKRK